VIWDVALRRLLRHAGTSFELDVRFASDAPRLALYGPSGAGKTLTLKTIAGIVRPDAARVCIGGRMLHDTGRGLRLSPQQRRLGYLFQDYALFPHLTVRQNIAFGRRTGWFNPGRAGTDEAVEHWIGAFRLEAVANHHPHQLSGGQRQRTALARALVNEPSALLLDEPFAALDIGLRRRLRSELAELQAGLGLPLLLITHDLDDVHALDAEVVPLPRGRVVEDPAMPLACHARA